MFYWSGCLSDDLHTEHDWVGAAQARCWQVPTNLNLYRSDTLLASPPHRMGDAPGWPGPSRVYCMHTTLRPPSQPGPGYVN